MSAIWDADDQPVCVRDVMDTINATRKRLRQKQLAYNTVQTVVTLLKRKKAVRQVPGPGRAHYFAPCFSREEASKQWLSDLSNRVFGGQVTPIIHQLIENADLSTDELAELRNWVDSKLKDNQSEK